MALVVTGKGLAFLREAFVASVLGASASSDGYYLALALPTVVYGLGALPFSMWVTARLGALKGAGDLAHMGPFYSRMLGLVVAIAVLLALALAGTAHLLVGWYAPGLDGERLSDAVALSRVGALAIPALAIQAVCNGRLFADGRFLPVYVWLVVGGLVGLGAVTSLAPHYGAAGAVWAFVAASWGSIIGPLFLGRPSASPPGKLRDVEWVDDLGVPVIYRAFVMQVYFQSGLLLVYAFGSTLPMGDLSASLFASKIQTAVYETVAVTAGILAYPRIAHFLQIRDHIAVRRTMLDVLNWLVPLTAGLVVLLVTCRREIVALIYERNAFDDRAGRLVASALLGYAPGIVGLTLVEIFHRAMVLRGRLQGYLVVFGAALAVNWLASYVLVPVFGVPGLTLSASLGVLVAGTGLVVYASRRLESMATSQILLLLARTTIAGGLTLFVLIKLHARIVIASSFLGHFVAVLGSMIGGAVILSLALLAAGHRWRVQEVLEDHV